MTPDRTWIERTNRRIGQLGRHAHAEIRRMADEARARVFALLPEKVTEESLGRGK